MSVRLARLLPVALIGACLATSAFAKTTHAHSKASATPKGPTLIWRGDVATATGVVDEVALAWQKAGHGSIELQPFNTASGIDAVASGAADLAGSARASDGSSEDSNLTFTPVAWDALVMVTQASNPVSTLTLKQLHDIYYGKITNWSEVGGQNAPIDVYAVASPGDGVEYSLRQLLFGRGNQPVAAPRLYVNTHQLEQAVALNSNGLGAATLSDISGNPKLKAIAINGVAPTASSIGNGSYVLFTPLYLVTNPRDPKAAQVTAFLDFLQTEPAKAAMRRHAVLPYQDGAALVSIDSSRRDKILAEAGARITHFTPTAPATMPAASEASRVAAASAVNSTIAAGQQLDRRGVHEQQLAASGKTQLSDVSGKVVGVAITSLAHVKGSVLASRNIKARHASKKAEESTAREHDAHHVASAGHAAATYRVAQGDTLFSIARKHAVDVAQLRDWNHLKGDNVKPGQSLRVSNNR